MDLLLTQLGRGGLGEGAHPERASRPQPTPGHSTASGTTGHLDNRGWSTLRAHEARARTEKTERATRRQRRPVVEARWYRVCERASTERARAAAAVRRRGVDREVDAAVPRTEVLQGSEDRRLIGYVDIERLGTCVADLRERLGGARGPCDRPAVISRRSITANPRFRAPITKAVGIRSASCQHFEWPAKKLRRKTHGPIPHRDMSVLAHGVASLVPLSTGASAERHGRCSSKKAWFAWPISIKWPSGSRK